MTCRDRRARKEGRRDGEADLAGVLVGLLLGVGDRFLGCLSSDLSRMFRKSSLSPPASIMDGELPMILTRWASRSVARVAGSARRTGRWPAQPSCNRFRARLGGEGLKKSLSSVVVGERSPGFELTITVFRRPASRSAKRRGRSSRSNSMPWPIRFGAAARIMIFFVGFS